MFFSHSKYYILFFILSILFIEYEAFQSNIANDDSLSLNLIQNDISYSPGNVLKHNSMIDSFNENSELKYLQKRKASDKQDKQKSKASSKKKTTQKPSKKKPSKVKTTTKKPTTKKPPTKKPPTKKPPTKKPQTTPTTTKSTSKKVQPKTTKVPSTQKPTPKPKKKKKPTTITTTTKAPETIPEMKAKLLEDINKLRVKHQAPQLIINETLQTDAQKFVDSIAKRTGDTEPFEDTIGTIFNVAPSKKFFNPLGSWTRGSEEINYENLDNINFHSEFTQLIWVSSTTIGCGVAEDENNEIVYTLCAFYPKGNNYEESKGNVFRPLE